MIKDEYDLSYGNLIQDLVSVQTAAPDEGQRACIYWTIEAFSYTSGSIMGGGTGLDHDHGAQPRHVRRFAQIVQAATAATGARSRRTDDAPPRSRGHPGGGRTCLDAVAAF